MKIVLELTNACNLNCTYCYRVHKSGPFNQVAKKDCYFRAVDGMLDKNNATSKHIVFFGGEPLLEYKTIIAISARYINEKSIKSFSINTNGTLINEKVADHLFEHQIAVSLGIDGNQKMHDRHRTTFNNQGTHIKAMKSLELLKRKGIKLAARMTICPENASMIETGIDYLSKNGITELGFAPATNMKWQKKSVNSWRISLQKLSKKYFLEPSKYPKIFDFEKLYENRKYNCMPGKGTVTIDFRGKIRPCHRSSESISINKIIPNNVDACVECTANSSCSKCVPKYGLSRPGLACELKKSLIRAVELVKIKQGENLQGDAKMGKYIVIDGQLYNIPHDILEKFRIPEESKRKVLSQGIVPVSKKVEPPLKGNWYELGEADCY